jgi:hypothetical protein
VACERQDKKPNSGTTVVVQHPTLLESLSFEERCRAAFASHAKDGVLPATSFDAAFRQAGYPDARQEEVDRYHVNFVQERKGIPGTHLREEEFVRILLGHDQKRRFLQTFRISSDDRVCNLVRSISHCFTRCTLQHGQHLWSHSSAESRMGIIMEGRAMLWARHGERGQVDFPMCELGKNRLVGDITMPPLATKVVAIGPVDMLFISMSEVKMRLGEPFIDEIADKHAGKNRHVQAQLRVMQRVCKRAKGDMLLASLPFLPARSPLREQLATGMQNLAKTQSEERAAKQAAKRAKAERACGTSTSSAPDLDDSRALSLQVGVGEKTRQFRMERAGKLPSAIALLPSEARPKSRLLRRPVTSSIPRRIVASEFRVRIDTSTMVYDDMM